MSARILTVAGLALAVVVVGVIVLGGGSSHRVSAMFENATNAVPGLEVRSAGVRVGEIKDIEYVSGQARFELDIHDDRVWPLRQGTRAIMRFGGTIGYVSRYIELKPGPDSAPPIPQDGLIPAAKTITPVDVDEILRLFDARTRAHLGRLLENGALTTGGLQRRLRQTLERTPAVTDQAQALLNDLGHDPETFDTLLRSTDRVVGAARTAEPGIDALIHDANTTFAALAARTPELQSTLERLPATLGRLRTTFKHADRSLVDVDALARELAPGATELRRTAGPLSSTLDQVRDIAPLLADTLRTARRGAPDLTNLLTRARSLAGPIGSIGDQADTQLNCIRPYAPEIAAFFDGWGGFVKNGDGIDKYFRVLSTVPAYPFGTTLTSAQIVGLTPNTTYAFPRPPGLNGKAPWFLPECGVGKDALDPSKDPEAAPNLPAGDEAVTRALVAGLLAVGGLAVGAVVLLGGGDDGYRGTVLLDNAAGLRKGSTVRIGGIAAGKVTDLKLGKDDVVVARFRLDEDAVPLHRGFRTTIRAANLLGEKYLQFDGGNPARPVASGSTVRLGDVAAPVELDDVLDVLDPETRVRTQVLINELGAALTGQKANFSALLEKMPPSFEAVDELVAQVADENRALGQAIDHSDRFVAALEGERAEIGRFVSAASGAISAFDRRRGELGATLDRTPRFLSSVTGWLAKLEAAAAPLKPAARLLAASAPGLHATLAQLSPFERAAGPALVSATSAAPVLGRLGREATPVVRQAAPAVSALSELSSALTPVSQTLDIAIDDTLGTVEGWARSIQNRDGIGHVFRGRFTGGMDLVMSALSELSPKPTKQRRRQPAKSPTAARPPAKQTPQAPRLPLPKVKVPKITIPGVGTTPEIDVTGAVDRLLDFLLKP